MKCSKRRTDSSRSRSVCLTHGFTLWPVDPEAQLQAGEGRGPHVRQSVQGDGSGLRRHRRQVGPLLRAGAGQLAASDTDRVQNTRPAVEQNLLLVSQDVRPALNRK